MILQEDIIMYKYSNSTKKNENIVFLKKEFSHEVERVFDM